MGLICSLSNDDDTTPSVATRREYHHHGSGAGGSASTLTLSNTLLKETGIIRNLVSFTSVPQTSRLLITCTEFYMAEGVILQKLPTTCDISSSGPWTGAGDECNEFKFYFKNCRQHANSRWLEWFDTLGVKELKLPKSMTDEEMLIMFRSGRFSKLQTLNLGFCTNITDASVMEVVRGCSNLQYWVPAI